jgi:hypothetical protein
VRRYAPERPPKPLRRALRVPPKGQPRPGTGLAVRQRLELCAARLLSALPPWAQVLLSGRPPVRVDGQTLEPEVQLALSLLERRGAPPLETLPLIEAREAYRRRVAVSNGPPIPVGADYHRYRIDRSCKKRMIGSMPLVIGRMPIKNTA